MRAAAYDRTGPAKDVLSLIDLPTPQPGAGEVRVKLATSGINPSDVKTRAGTRSKLLAFPQIVPHSDGAGVIDAVGKAVDRARIGERVWTWNAAWQRPHGTAAQFIVLPSAQAVQLPDRVDFAAGACLGIPALTAYHAVVMDGGVQDKTVLVALTGSDNVQVWDRGAHWRRRRGSHHRSRFPRQRETGFRGRRRQR